MAFRQAGLDARTVPIRVAAPLRGKARMLVRETAAFRFCFARGFAF